MHPIRDAFAVIKTHNRAFLVLNVTFYGMFVVAMFSPHCSPNTRNQR